MVICYLYALKKFSKRNETRIKKEIVEVLQQSSYRRKRKRKLKIEMMEFLALALYLLARTTRTLISSSAIIGYFKKSIFRDLT